MKNKIFILVLFFFLITSACGGGSSGGGGGDNNDGNNGASSEEVQAAQALTNLPSLDASDYDLTAASAEANLSAVTKALHIPEGEFSMAGCEANRHKDEMIRITKEMQSIQCMAEKGNENGVIETGQGDFNYYVFEPKNPNRQEGRGSDHEGSGNRGRDESGGGQEDSDRSGNNEGRNRSGSDRGDRGGEESHDGEDSQHIAAKAVEGEEMEDHEGEEDDAFGEMKMRLGIFCENSSGASVDFESDGSCVGILRFKMDMCLNGTLGMEMRYAITDSRYVGRIYHQFRSPHGGDAERGSVSLDVNTEPSGGFDFTSARIVGNMISNRGEGAMSLVADATNLTNTVQGNFTSEFTDPLGNSLSNTGSVASRWGGETGCGKFEGTGEFPAMSCPYEDWVPYDFKGQPCCMLPPEEQGEREQYVSPDDNGNCAFNFSDTEPYTITLEEGVPVDWLVSAENIYCDEVGALADLERSEPTPNDNWDCTAPEGRDFEEPNFSAVRGDPFEECFDHAREAEGDGEFSICMQDFGSEKRDQHRAGDNGNEGEGGPRGPNQGPPELIDLTLESSVGCDENPLPDSARLFLDQNGEFFGLEANVNFNGSEQGQESSSGHREGPSEHIGGGEIIDGGINNLHSGFDPNQGMFDDGHFSCNGTVSETRVEVTGCADGCSFTYVASE